MIWYNLKSKPTDRQIAEEATEQLAKARDERKSALARLMQKLEELPLDNAVADIGKDIGGQRK